MKRFRLISLLMSGALVLSACNQEATTSAVTNNTLLVHVPADTPYLYANLEPTPDAVIDAFVMRMGTSMAGVQALISDFQIEVNPDNPLKNDEARLLAAIIGEFNGKLNREGLESLGLSAQSHMAAYGMGMFPVVRISLSNAEALRAAIGRIETNSGREFTQLESNGDAYWKVQDNSGEASVYLAILDDHFAFSMFPSSLEEKWLPAFLGQQLPANSTAAAELNSLNSERGFTNYGSGFIDFQRIADQLLDPASTTGSWLGSLGQDFSQKFDAQCQAELRSMIAKAPRLVGGTTELTTNRLGISYQLEMESSLAQSLSGLVAEVPVAASDPSKLLSAAIGIKIGKFRDFLKQQATAITESPYTCEQFKDLNVQAEQALVQLNQPLPPFVNNLKGFRVSLNDFDVQDFDPSKANGLFSLEVEKPQMLIGMAQMFIPGLGDMTIEPGSDPIAVPQELLSLATPDMQVYAAMGNDSIGLALGEASKEELITFMNAGDNNKNVFFSLEYDMARQLELQEQWQKSVMSGDDEYANLPHGELIRQMQDAYKQYLGRSRLEVSFDENGIRVDTTMDFK